MSRTSDDGSTVIVSYNGDRSTATVTLNRPHALNAITIDMLEAMTDALVAIERERSARTVVLTGAGRAFSAGVDLKALAGEEIVNGSVGDVLDRPARRVIEQITMLPAIVIATVHGFCFTGALELALACDIVLCADEARMADTHAKWGMRPSWGMSARLPLLVGHARARMLSYTAMEFTGLDAARWGLAAASWPQPRFDDEAARVIAEIGANSHGSLLAYKSLYRRAESKAIDGMLADEAAARFSIADSLERLRQFR